MWSSRVHGLRYSGNAVATAVLDSVVQAGGEPLTLFAHSNMTPVERLRHVDALLVPGGYDVHPARYGEEPDESITLADHESQDQFDSEMIDAAIELGIPALLICRGFQMLNVNRGGTLIQDLPEDSVHRDSTHTVSIDEDSILGRVVNRSETTVSSYHHQAIGRLGDGLRVTATGPDAVAEALQLEEANLIAVQWHPEDTAHREPHQAAIFNWLVNEAVEYRKGSK